MRRISLALALLGAVAAAGCGGAGNQGSESGTGGNKGIAQNTFTITIQNGQNGNTGLAIRDGYVTSTPPGLDCGSGTHGVCSFAFPKDSTVTLTATANTGKLFLGWAADCVGIANTCAITGQAADQYVLAQFGTEADRTSHPNWSVGANGDGASLHSSEARKLLDEQAGAINCANCHGPSLTGAGLAVSCAGCHGGSATALTRWDAATMTTLATGETCATCHAGADLVHQAKYNRYSDATTLAGAIGTVQTSPNADGTYLTTVSFTLTKAGVAFNPSGAKQKRYMATKLNADGTFDASNAVSVTFGSATGSGPFKVVAPKAAFDLNATPSFLYFYFGDSLIVPATGHYNLMDNVVSLSKLTGGAAISYVSTANVSACENCHGAPYKKHGYREAVVAGLPDFVACKACHYDGRPGTDFDWQVLANDPAALASITANGTKSANWTVGYALGVAGKYGYTASVMNDTHMSHAMEFAYPQSMGKCATCHAGKLDSIFAESNFNGVVCKSCHPTTATKDVAKRAPSFKGELLGAALSHHRFEWSDGTILADVWDATNLVTVTQHRACTYCHSDAADNCSGGTAGAVDGVGPTCYGYQVPLFKDLHPNFDNQVYTDETQATRIAANTFMTISSSSFDTATNILTVNFSTNAVGSLVKPTVVVSLYGGNTKDFIVNGHGSGKPWVTDTTDTKRWLEWAEGSTSNGTRLTVSPATASVGNTTWTATANLSAFASLLASGQVTRAEVGVLPVMALDPDQAVSSTNPAVAMGGATSTVSLTGTGGLLAAVTPITDVTKCNKCHSALGVEFHSPSYGSAGTLGCRLCHQVGNGGSHLEMQSRSIDSYVHAIHAFQKMDIKDVNFADPVQAMEYEHHIGSTYPNFTTLSCESCHNAGTYGVPDQTKSMPGILSASSVITGTSRAVGSVPSVVTGPAARACGSCHRSELIKADDAFGLNAFDKHTEAFGYRVVPTQSTGGVLESTYQVLLRVYDVLF